MTAAEEDVIVDNSKLDLRNEHTSSTDRPYDGWGGKRLSPAACGKVSRFRHACREGCEGDPLDIMATSTGGLVDDEVRRIAWPLLLGYEVEASGSDEEQSQRWRDLPRHKDEDQVELDVNRSFIYYPKNESSQQLDRRKQQLSDVITQVLRSHPRLSYFQGFHDIVQVFLLVLGPTLAPNAVAHLSLLRIRDFMLPSLSPSLAHLRLLPSILDATDAKLCQHLSKTQPFFALAATLTLYAHDIQEYGDIARLFDFLLAQEAVVSVYFFAVIILSRREELFEIPADEPEMLHSVLSKLPKPLDLETLISRTVTLFTVHPPERLPWRAWSKISTFSVLKTTRGKVTQQQTLRDGEELFEKQVAQLKREEQVQRVKAVLWNYRRPARNFGLAVFVGVLSFWLRRNGIDGLGLQRVWSTFRALGRY